MNEPLLTNHNRIRARPTGLISPVTRQPVFRIEDRTGLVLRRISSARSASEALVHYWRMVGSNAKFAPAMAEPPLDARLRRQIDAARSARDRGAAVRDIMQTHELPLPAPSLLPDMNEPPPPVPRSAPAKRRGSRTGLQSEDLFGASDHEAVDPPMDSRPPPDPEPDITPDHEPEPEHETAPKPEAGAPVAEEREPAHSGPYHLDPHSVLLQQVDHRNLRPTDRNDSYLYHISNGAEARTALENGLMVSAQDPIILTERQGVAYWLSVLAEDFDVILDGPADFIVLRLRRIAVETLLEADPDASRSAGCGCYLLTGGPGIRK